MRTLPGVRTTKKENLFPNQLNNMTNFYKLQSITYNMESWEIKYNWHVWQQQNAKTNNWKPLNNLRSFSLCNSNLEQSTWQWLLQGDIFLLTFAKNTGWKHPFDNYSLQLYIESFMESSDHLYAFSRGFQRRMILKSCCGLYVYCVARLLERYYLCQKNIARMKKP